MREKFDDPTHVSFQLERADLEELERLAGPNKRSAALREAVRCYLDRSKVRASDAGGPGKNVMFVR